MRMSAVAVEATDVVLGYGSTVAVGKSTFSIPRGQVTAVIGPNGSGKSTLLNAIGGLITPMTGTLDVLPGLERRPRISYVFQTTKVNDALPISVREVVAMGRYAHSRLFRWLDTRDREAIAEAMERTGVSHLAGKHLSELSGGQRQRVFVAQGLAQEHDILLLDEPLTGIDITAAQAIDEVIHDEVTRGCSVIITTHDLSEARIADSVVLMAGHVVSAGIPEEVLTRSNLTEAYGPALLHVDGDHIFIDDAAHQPVPGRHVHQERSIHTESSPSEIHPES